MPFSELEEMDNSLLTVRGIRIGVGNGHIIAGKESRMDSLTGMDGRFNGVGGYGEVQKEGCAAFTGPSPEGFIAVEYTPFDEGDDVNQEACQEDPGLMAMEGYLPADSAQTQDTFPEEGETGETQSEEEAGPQYLGEQDAEVSAEESEGEKLDEPEDEPEPAGTHAADSLEEQDSPDADATEERKRAEHEASEAKRKADWEARQQAKKDAIKAQLERIGAMNDEELVSESMKRVGAYTEKLTRRNMKECVSEYIQTACLEDAAFARQVMLPQKNMVRCFQYINRKAYEYVQDEMKADGIEPGRDMPCYSADISDGLCYHWAEEYFRTMDVKEDKEEEEKFIPKPYAGKAGSGSKGKKTGAKKSSAKKPATTKAAEKRPSEKKASESRPEKKPENRKSADDGQLSFMGQMSFGDMLASVAKAG